MAKHCNVPKFGNGDIVNVPSTAQIKGREKADEAKASDTYSSNHILSCMEKGSHEISGKDAQHDLEQRSKKFRSYLRWVFVVQSNIYKSVLSWSVFFTLTFIVPVMSQYLLHCRTACDANHRRPYHIPVQISLTVFATLSFICLSRWDRKYGLSKFLFLDKVSNENLKIQRGYAEQMQGTMKLILRVGLPCFLAACADKIWWYVSGASQIPYYGEMHASSIILCALELWSWLYRTSIFFAVCVLFRLICSLQILKLDELAIVFQRKTEVESILLEHQRIKRNLQIISHRFRSFILASMLLVSASQFSFLLMATKPHADVNVLKAGELAIVSFTLLSGLLILLRSATKITHKAQSVIGLAAKWHICAAIHSFENINGETQTTDTASAQAIATNVNWGLPDEEVGDEDDEFDNTKLLPVYTHTISFHTRQALVTYMENNRAGISVFGFMLDRTWLQTIFAIQTALFLWLLNKTVFV
ncbi:uncharacterized protein LOC130722615 isoform X2 [Lotus japonicus]|nr:uncharacterized protein LOC130722615 isoform X2 [Lotus japonicus]